MRLGHDLFCFVLSVITVPGDVQTCYAGAMLILLLEMMYCKELGSVRTSSYAFLWMYNNKMAVMQKCSLVFSVIAVTVVSLEMNM
jgi:hypothetical protein